MSHNKIEEITIPFAKTGCGYSCLDDEILLYDDFTKVPLPNEPHRMGCTLLALCLNGKAQYTVNTTTLKVQPNDVIIITAGQVIGDYMLSPDCQGIAIMITEPRLRDIMANIKELSSLFLFSRFHPVYNLQPKEVKDIREYFQLIKRKAEEQENRFRHDIVRMLMSALIGDFSNAAARVQKMTEKKSTRAEEIFTDFIRLVERHFREERRVVWYSQQLNITSKYLSETVKLASRRTPFEWIDNYVMLEIRVLLKNSNLSVKDIAQQLHFSSLSSLGRYFKERAGVSPTEYREM